MRHQNRRGATWKERWVSVSCWKEENDYKTGYDQITEYSNIKILSQIKDKKVSRPFFYL